MSPEYGLSGVFSVKSDVYSFGVVVIEIVSGKCNTGPYQSQEISSLLACVSIVHLVSLSFILSISSGPFIWY